MKELFQPGTTKPEADYLEFERLSGKLGIPALMVHLTLEAKDAEGNITFSSHDRSRSFNRNYWNMAFMNGAPPVNYSTAAANYYGDGSLGCKDYRAGAVSAQTLNNYSAAMYNTGSSGASIGQDTAGICIGAGGRVERFDGTALGAQILNGTSLNRMSYIGQTEGTPSYNSGTNTWSTVSTRIFNNNSGASVVVRECGILGYLAVSNTPIIGPAVFTRDVLGAPITVASAGQITVTYTYSLVFPSTTAVSAFSEVQLLTINDNAANGTNTYTDQSSYARAVTGIGTKPLYSNTTAPTGMTTVAAFIGTGALSIADTAALEILDNDFELSFMYRTTLGAGGHTTGETVFAKRANATSFSPIEVVWIDSGTLSVRMSSNGTSANLASVIIFNSVMNANTWYYCTVVRVGGGLYCYVNGTIVSSSAITSVGAIPIDNSSAVTIGGNPDATGYLQSTSYISNLRFTIGSSRTAGSNTLWWGGSADQYKPGATWTLPLSTTL